MTRRLWEKAHSICFLVYIFLGDWTTDILFYRTKTLSFMNCYHQWCIKYFQKVFQLQITKYILKKYFNYFCQLLWTNGPKYKIHLKKVIEIQNTFRSHCESISQSINEYSFNKQEKHERISRPGIGTVIVTIQCTVNKKKHRKYWLKHNT